MAAARGGGHRRSVDASTAFCKNRHYRITALAADSDCTLNQLIGEWQASTQEDHIVHQILHPEEEKDTQAQEQHSYLVEPSQNVLHQQQIDSQLEHESLIVQKENLSTDQHQLQGDHVVEKNLVSISQQNFVHKSQQDKFQHPESQQESLIQLLNDKQASTSDQANNQMRRMKSGSIPFNVLIPALCPHLDKDRNMQLDAVFTKLRSNEITKEHFLRVIRNIVGDQMLRQAVHKVQTQIRSQIPSSAPPVAAGASTRAPTNKFSIGQKKPLESQGTLPLTSKKQKVSNAYLDQSIQQLNDVAAVSGVNLREEEELLLFVPKEESRASEATRRVDLEEEERLILQKGPLQKKLVEIMNKCGIKNISSDVERCLSLSVEEYLSRLISNLIRVSRQRVDIEKARHQIVSTSDVRRQIFMVNKRAKEEWEKKQAGMLWKENESEGTNGDADKEKDEGGRSKSLKSTMLEYDKMRTTAANVAVRAAVGGDDMLSKWQLMAEQARQKREGGLDALSGALPGRTTSNKPLSNFGTASTENQEVEKKGPSVASAAYRGDMRKYGRIMSHTKVARSISAKDVISILEREWPRTNSTFIYRLYDRILSNRPA